MHFKCNGHEIMNRASIVVRRKEHIELVGGAKGAMIAGGIITLNRLCYLQVFSTYETLISQSDIYTVISHSYDSIGLIYQNKLLI